MIPRMPGLVCLLLILSTVTHAAGPSPAQRFNMQADKPSTDFYLYIGGDIAQLPDGSDDILSAPFELRALTPWNGEFGVSSALQHAHLDGRSRSEAGDTVVRYSQGMRFDRIINFAAIEYAKVFSTAPAAFSSGVKQTLQARLQGGYTLLGYDITITHADLEEVAGLGNESTTYSVGYRGQHRRLQFGFDFVRSKRDGTADLDFLDFVLVQRNHDGNSFYGLIEKGISDENEAWYVGFGYEFQLGD